MSTLNTTRVELLKTQSQLNSTQSQLNTTQSQLSTVQSQLTTTQAQLHTAQVDLSNTKVELNKTKQDLNDTTRQLFYSHMRLVAALSPEFINSTLGYKNHVYLLSRTYRHNITSYQESCGTLGGKLAEIHDEDEFHAITGYLRHQHMYGQNIYIGMTDEGNEGDWRYMSDNTPITFAKWYSGQPNGDGNCAIINTASKKMDDKLCFDHRSSHFLCKVSL